jgi:cation diffusion facilitator family transporter
MSAEGDSKHIIQSLAVNVIIALVKFVAAFFTKSGAMLAEALHSTSDCRNQILLLVGVKQSKKPPSEKHPFGYGRAIYFWSFMVALMLFLGGGVFSIYEGIHKTMTPERVEHAWVGLGILAVSLALEGYATLSNIKELNARRGKAPFFKFLADTTDSDLVVVFAENAAAVLGLALAMVALALAAVTDDGKWDGIGGIAIGVVLLGVAGFLAVEVSSLLLGEAAAPEIAAATRDAAKEHPEFERILNVITMQHAPRQVLVHIKIQCTGGTSVEDLCRAINEFEDRLRRARPEIRWVYVEPDLPRDPAGDRGEKPPAGAARESRASAEA